MLRADQFQPITVRLVAFTPNVSDFKPSEIFAAVLGQFSDRFTGEIQSIPLPENVPADIPRIQLSSPDGVWTFSASPSRVTSAWNLKDSANETVDVSNLELRCREAIQEHLTQNRVQVGRLAFVLTRVCPCDSPAQELIDRFCHDEVKAQNSPDAPLRNSRNFEIHNHKRYELPIDDLTINSWVRCKSGTSRTTDSRVVTVEHDINTLAEEIDVRSFDVDSFNRFYETVVREADEILQKYFPII